MLRLLTNEELIKSYGNPSKYVDEDGNAASAWSASILDSFFLPKPLPLSWGGSARRVSCHRLLAPQLKRVFDSIYKVPEAWATIGDYGGCYQWRRNKNNPAALSRHCWGVAVDLDTRDNPNGLRGEMHPLIIEAFYDEGFVWGGWFKNKPDPMHFEIGVKL